MASLIHRKKWFSWTGKAKYALPNVVGMKEADALARIGQAQNPGTRTEAASATIMPGRVVSTNPAAGVKNYPDTVSVAYVVCNGLTCLATDATDSVAVVAGHGIAEGDPIWVTWKEATLSGIAENTQYFAKSVGPTILKFSATKWGAVLPLTGTGSVILETGVV